MSTRRYRIYLVCESDRERTCYNPGSSTTPPVMKSEVKKLSI